MSDAELKKQYNAYKKQWIADNVDDVTMGQTFAKYHEEAADTKTFEEYVNEYGFAGDMRYDSFDEWQLEREMAQTAYDEVAAVYRMANGLDDYDNDENYAEEMTDEDYHAYMNHFCRTAIADEKILPSWAAKRLAEIRAPQMEIRIFQIDRDKDSKHLSFKSYAETMQKGGVDASIYHQVYGGTVNCSSLEDVFALCNSGHPPGYYGHSLSVSDVIEVCSGDQKGFYFCDSFGFKQIGFDIGQTDHDKMLRALIVECGKEPYVGEIQDCLKAKQSVVGGLIEPIYFDRTDRALVYCDEEFLLKGCEPNRYVGDCLVHSTFMIIGNGQNEYGEGIEVSLTDEQIEKYAEQFRYPVIYDPAHSAEQAEEETEDFSFSQA